MTSDACHRATVYNSGNHNISRCRPIASRYCCFAVINMINIYHRLRLRFTAERAHPLHNAFGIISRLYRHAPVAPFMRVASGIFIVNLGIFQTIVFIVYGYFVPTIFSAGKVDVFERIAISKSSIAYLSNTTAHFNSCQFFTTEKHVFFNACHTVGNCYTCKTCTTGESIASDACHATGNCYACKTCTVGESIASDACHAVRNRYTCKTRATAEGCISYVCYTVGNCYAYKTCTAGESRTFDACHTVRNYISISLIACRILDKCCLILVEQHTIPARIIFIILIYGYTCKAYTTREHPASKKFHTVGDCYACKTCTVGESIASDAHHTVGDRYIC